MKSRDLLEVEDWLERKRRVGFQALKPNQRDAIHAIIDGLLDIEATIRFYQIPLKDRPPYPKEREMRIEHFRETTTEVLVRCWKELAYMHDHDFWRYVTNNGKEP